MNKERGRARSKEEQGTGRNEEQGARGAGRSKEWGGARSGEKQRLAMFLYIIKKSVRVFSEL